MFDDDGAYSSLPAYRAATVWAPMSCDDQIDDDRFEPSTPSMIQTMLSCVGWGVTVAVNVTWPLNDGFASEAIVMDVGRWTRPRSGTVREPASESTGIRSTARRSRAGPSAGAKSTTTSQAAPTASDAPAQPSAWIVKSAASSPSIVAMPGWAALGPAPVSVTGIAAAVPARVRGQSTRDAVDATGPTGRELLKRTCEANDASPAHVMSAASEATRSPSQASSSMRNQPPASPHASPAPWPTRMRGWSAGPNTLPTPAYVPMARSSPSGAISWTPHQSVGKSPTWR